MILKEVIRINVTFQTYFICYICENVKNFKQNVFYMSVSFSLYEYYEIL